MFNIFYINSDITMLDKFGCKMFSTNFSFAIFFSKLFNPTYELKNHSGTNQNNYLGGGSGGPGVGLGGPVGGFFSTGSSSALRYFYLF